MDDLFELFVLLCLPASWTRVIFQELIRLRTSQASD
jgi:hypothetical protein